MTTIMLSPPTKMPILTSRCPWSSPPKNKLLSPQIRGERYRPPQKLLHYAISGDPGPDSRGATRLPALTTELESSTFQLQYGPTLDAPTSRLPSPFPRRVAAALSPFRGSLRSMTAGTLLGHWPIWNW